MFHVEHWASGQGGFAPTRWSVVLAAAGDAVGTSARRALAELIRIYWFPLYAFIRRNGHAPPAAEDLTQDFFTRLLEKREKHLGRVDRSRGRFRSFLLASAKHFLANEWDKARARKRGGRARVVALDGLDAEARYAIEPVEEEIAYLLNCL